MTPITKEMSDEKKDEMISQALKAPENAVLVQNLQSRGMSQSDLLGQPELRRAAEESPGEIKERVHDFLQKLSEESGPRQAPTESQPVEKSSAGHIQAPTERQEIGKAAGDEQAPSEKKKKKEKT